MITFDQFKDLLVNKYNINPNNITPDARVSDLGLDSLVFIEVLFDAEDLIGKKIPESAIKPEQVELTVEELCTLINSIQQGYT